MNATGDDAASDESLVNAINRGDDRAFETLYFRYRDWVVRLARRFTGNDEDALDVMQETFSYVFGKCPSLRLTARMTTFLYPVIRNLSIAARRKRNRLISDETALQNLTAPPEDEVERSELAAALARLPEAQREVLLMRFVDGMSLLEIAAALAIPSGTVKSRLHNAIAFLRDDPRTRRHFDR